MPEEIRTFIAIELPESIRRGLAQVQEQLRRGRHPVRWVTPDRIHLTLKFLGEISSEQVEAVAAATQRIAAAAAPFTLEAVGAGVYPNPRRARVVWVGIGGARKPLEQLQANLEEALTELGFPPERRPFSPHLTLGRTRRRTKSSQARALGQAVTSMEPPALGSWQVEEVVVMRSDLRPQGPIYTPLHVAKLGQ